MAKSLRLKGREKINLNASISPAVRNFLETADAFEIFAQMEVRDGKLRPAMNEKELVPNFKAPIGNSVVRKKVLRALYSEASKGEARAMCWLPSHSIVAYKGDQKVTLEICFACNRFSVSGALGESDGTFSRNSGETERIVLELVAELGVTTK